jgi:hypothetical protein
MNESNDDLVKAGVERLFDESEMLVLLEGSKAIAETSPRLSDAQIARIADRVADAVLRDFEHEIAPSKKEHWKKILTKLCYDLAVGVAASALWGLMGSLAHVFAYLDSGDAELEARKRRREDALARLVARVPADAAPKYEYLLQAPWMAQSIIDEMARAVAASGAIGEIEGQVAKSHGRLPSSNARTGAGWVGNRMAVDLFYALEHEAAEQLGEPPIMS